MSASTVLNPEPQGDAQSQPAAGGSLPSGVKINAMASHCEKCGALLGGKSTSICKKCGWYAVAGVYVDIDRSWEADPDERPAATQSGKIPGWAWVVIGSVVTVILASGAARAFTADGSVARSAISGVQFLVGVVAFLTAQIVGFKILMRQDSTAALLDILLKPFKVSAMLFRDLPRRTWIVNMGISGAVAALAAVLIIGSVPYQVLWSWSVDYRSQQHLEDALAQEMNPGKLPDKEKQDKQRKTISGIIIGYELNDGGTLRSILVARESNGKLLYAGGVTPTGDSALLFELRENLMAIPATRSVIPMPFNSNWVLPKYTCQISYGQEQENKSLTEIRWEGDVRAMRLPGE
jgi:hypothetical protein